MDNAWHEAGGWENTRWADCLDEEHLDDDGGAQEYAKLLEIGHAVANEYNRLA